MTAELDLWHRGPSRAPVSQNTEGVLMKMPLQYRVSGPFQRKGPIETPGFQARLCIASPEGSRNNYEGCYYVTPRILRAHPQTRVLLKHAPACRPLMASFVIFFYTGGYHPPDPLPCTGLRPGLQPLRGWVQPSAACKQVLGPSGPRLPVVVGGPGARVYTNSPAGY